VSKAKPPLSEVSAKQKTSKNIKIITGSGIFLPIRSTKESVESVAVVLVIVWSP